MNFRNHKKLNSKMHSKLQMRIIRSVCSRVKSPLTTWRCQPCIEYHNKMFFRRLNKTVITMLFRSLWKIKKWALFEKLIKTYGKLFHIVIINLRSKLMHSNSKEQIDQIPTHAKRRRILSELFNCFCCNFIHSLLACSDLNWSDALYLRTSSFKF